MRSLCIVLWTMTFASAAVYEIKPALDERVPSEIGELDLRQLTPAEAVALGAKLATRHYATEKFKNNLTIQVTAEAESVFAIDVAKASIGGARLIVKVGDEAYAKSWPPAGKTHEVNTIFSVPVPPGEQTIKIAMNSGVVVVHRYLWLPTAADRAGLALVALEPAGQVAEVPELPADLESKPVDGFRGCWFNLGQEVPVYGPKYSGGLATYTAKHRPIAVYAAAVEKTFFCYGGDGPNHDLTINIATFDHRTGEVSRPTQVLHWIKYNDPHCNAAVQLDTDGYVWVFVSGRGRARAGYKLRSARPYDISKFDNRGAEELTYPQAWYSPGRGFFHFFTKYTAGRELYFETADPKGDKWTDDVKLAGFGGHYQITAERDGRILTAFNWHPNGNVDKRTNIYLALTDDWGKSWHTVDGQPLTLPLDSPQNPALLYDYQAEGKNVYIKDTAFDDAGRPCILYLTSHGGLAGPTGEPRQFEVRRWLGDRWQISVVARGDHNYDTGSLYLDGESWTVIIPSGAGPQPWMQGGEVFAYHSGDGGQTWDRGRPVTTGSERNLGYVRRPVPFRDPFAGFFADGNPAERSISRLYFTDSHGEGLWLLPDTMAGETAKPEKLR